MVVLDDEVSEFLAVAGAGAPTEGDAAARRAAILQLSDRLFTLFGETGPPVAQVEDHWVEYRAEHGTDGAERGSGRCRVRVYRPDLAGPLPLHLFIHGGAYWLGSADELVNDATCRERAVGAGCVVVSVDYRLSPEHPFPTALEDCYAALVWARDHAETLGVDPHRLSVGGISAGGTLAAAVALAARDRNGPALVLQLLEVPLLDLSLETLRRSGVGDGFGITEPDLRWSIEQYLTRPGLLDEPTASPLAAASLAGLPPAVVLTAECDPLRDDGRRYAAGLERAGGSATLIEQPGAVHGSLQLTATWAPARAWRDRVRRALIDAHGTALVPTTSSLVSTTSSPLDPTPRAEHNQGGI